MPDLRPLSASMSKLTTEAFSRKFIALGRILTQWDAIVGADMAGKTQPIKLHYRKPKEKGESPQAALDIAASSADATLLHYQKDLILERINQIFGDRWITSIRFVHIASNRDDDLSYASASSMFSPLSAAEKERLQAILPEIDDEDLRKRLEKLGQSVLRKERSSGRGRPANGS